MLRFSNLDRPFSVSQGESSQARKKEARRTEDAEIIGLYLQRDEAAIRRTKERYGRQLAALALRILGNREDAEEAESDTYLRAWNSIPPQRPEHLRAYLAAICRNAALDRLERDRAQKRSAELVALTAELESCIPDAAEERKAEAEEIGRALSAFLRTQPKEARVIFVRRYVLAESVGGIARSLHVSESKVKSSLFRTRNKLRDWLRKEEIEP